MSCPEKTPGQSIAKATTEPSCVPDLYGCSWVGPSDPAREASTYGKPPPVTRDVFEVVADGNTEVLQEIIEFSGAYNLCRLRNKSKENYGGNLLHCAVMNGQLETLQVLLNHKVFDPNQVG